MNKKVKSELVSEIVNVKIEGENLDDCKEDFSDSDSQSKVSV